MARLAFGKYLLTASRFLDQRRGNGYMTTLHFPGGWLCLGFRPRDWHLYYVKLPIKPGCRLYLGPLEFELIRTYPTSEKPL